MKVSMILFFIGLAIIGHQPVDGRPPCPKEHDLMRVMRTSTPTTTTTTTTPTTTTTTPTTTTTTPTTTTTTPNSHLGHSGRLHVEVKPYYPILKQGLPAPYDSIDDEIFPERYQTNTQEGSRRTPKFPRNRRPIENVAYIRDYSSIPSLADGVQLSDLTTSRPTDISQHSQMGNRGPWSIPEWALSGRNPLLAINDPIQPYINHQVYFPIPPLPMSNIYQSQIYNPRPLGTYIEPSIRISEPPMISVRTPNIVIPEPFRFPRRSITYRG